MKGIRIITLFIIVMGMFACNNSGEKKTKDQNLAGLHKVLVEETVDVSVYTYMRVKEDSDEYWMAVPKQAVETGKNYYYKDRVEMHDFESSELGKTFDLIYFVEEISTSPQTTMHAHQNPHTAAEMGAMHAEHLNVKAKEEIAIEPVEGGISIAELYKNREDYKNKEVTIKGKVVKVNAQIMDRNWVHLQDGTEHEGSFDITITTNENVQVGDVVTFKGKIALKKDFGSGYFYEVIMEQGMLQ